VTGYEQIIYEFPEELCGWKWNIQNDISRRCITIIRQLSTPGGTETAKRPIYTVPGGFDPDLIAFDGKSVRYIEGIGWVLVYAGAKWQEENGRKTSLTSYGIIILDRENPERVLYRSTEPVSGIIEECEGWKISGSSVKASMLLDEVKMHIPERVIFEIKRMYELIDAGKCWRSHMTAWLKNKAKCK
jgi:hypothetical protein